MTAAEVYESVTNGGASDFADVTAILNRNIRGKVWAWQDATRRLSKRKKDELDLLRIAEAYPELRRQIPAQIVEQLK
jgi:hypothetical protein